MQVTVKEMQLKKVSKFCLIFEAPGGESDTLAVLDEEACARCIQENRDVIVGVKVRLTAAVCGQGSTEMEAYRFLFLSI